MNATPHETAIEAIQTARYRAFMTTNKKADVAGAIAAMQAASNRGRGRKSPAYRWLYDRHDALAEAFLAEPPSWAALAKYLGDHDVFGADGKPPTASSLRSAWLRVTADVAKRRAGKPGVKQQAEPASADPPVLSPAPAPSGDARARFQEQFKRAVIRKKPEE